MRPGERISASGRQPRTVAARDSRDSRDSREVTMIKIKLVGTGWLAKEAGIDAAEDIE